MAQTESPIISVPDTSRKTRRKHRLQGFVAGLLVMAVLAAAGWGLARLLADREPDPLGGGLTWQSVEPVSRDRFEAEVLQAPGQTVVYFNDYSIKGPILDNILENIAMNWGGNIRMFEAVYSQLDFIRGLGIDDYGLPLFAVFENGVLVGQRGMAVEENQISVWLDTFRAAHIYRAFPRTAFDSVGDGSDSTYFVSELVLMPERTGLSGFIRCKDNTVLPVEKHTALYALMGNTFGGSGRTSFGLPNLDARIPAPGLRYFICRDGRFPLRDEDWHLNAVVNGDIKYLEFPIGDLNSNSFIGEVVLVKGEPDEWYDQLMVPCDGRMLSMRNEPILGSLLGNRFGGDGVNTYAVPDLSNVTIPVAGARYYIMLRLIYPTE